MKETIGIAADHGGKELKRLVREFLSADGYDVIDFGVSENSEASVDYPDYAALLAADVSNGKLDRGILMCGSGIGMSITANKFAGVRAALVWDDYTARMCRKHNDANVICLGGRTLNHLRAVDFVKIWLETKFEGGRHDERLRKIRMIEKQHLQK